MRGSMIYDFFKRNSPIIGKSDVFIISQLGNSTGYHDYESNPAYYIGPKPPGSNAKAYLLAFIVDHNTRKITEIYIEPKIK